jgi:hypothetical protein
MCHGMLTHQREFFLFACGMQDRDAVGVHNRRRTAFCCLTVRAAYAGQPRHCLPSRAEFDAFSLCNEPARCSAPADSVASVMPCGAGLDPTGASCAGVSHVLLARIMGPQSKHTSRRHRQQKRYSRRKVGSYSQSMAPPMRGAERHTVVRCVRIESQRRPFQVNACESLPRFSRWYAQTSLCRSWETTVISPDSSTHQRAHHCSNRSSRSGFHHDQP